MHVETTRYCHSPTRMSKIKKTILNVGEDMVQQELLYTSGVGVK